MDEFFVVGAIDGAHTEEGVDVGVEVLDHLEVRHVARQERFDRLARHLLQKKRDSINNHKYYNCHATRKEIVET